MRGTFQTVIALSLSLLVLTSGCVIPAMIHLKQGDSYAEQGQIEEAVGEYSQAIELSPKLSAAYIGRGLAYFDQGQWTLTIRDLNRAIELAPQFTTELSPKLALAYSNRGHDYITQRHDYITQRQCYLAIVDLTKAIELDPDSSTARIYADRGKAHLETRQSAYARNDYNRAIELDPQLLTGQELADIMRLSSSRVSTVRMDIDTVITGLIGDTVSDSCIVLIGDTFSDSCIVLTTAVGIYDYRNKKMNYGIDSNSYVCSKVGQDLSNSYGVSGEGQNLILQELFVEYYVISESEYVHMYTKDSKIDFWYKFEPSVQLWVEHDQFCRQRDLMKTALDIMFIGIEMVDGVDCFTILVKPNITELNNLLLSLRPHGLDFRGIDLSELLKTVEIKEWITMDEYLPVKMEMDILGIAPQVFPISSEGIDKVNMKIQMKFRCFNRPVVIELPPEALEAR
ncbi:MAG: tetratricopeptide repeat protein [Chloroflexota bacterium]|nr:MAG: tetratricopeptide repeat protein [Chloroflexota bacterium]